MDVEEIDKKYLVGTRFGSLEVVSFTIGKKGGITCKCECECGNEKSWRLYKLLNEGYISCGCLSSRSGGKRKMYVSPVQAMLKRKDHLKRNHPMYYAKL